MNVCQCGDPATRLVRVVYVKSPAQRNDGTTIPRNHSPVSFDRSTHFASCEAHRHSAKRDILEKSWAKEIADGDVKVLLGPKRRAGR